MLVEDLSDVCVFYKNVFILKHLFEIFIIYIDLNEVSFFLVHMIDEINVDTPSDVPEEVFFLLLTAFDCI